MSQSYIEAHKSEEAIRSLEQKVSLLITKSKEQTGKNDAFEKKIHALEKRNEELETRLNASYVAFPFPMLAHLLPSHIHPFSLPIPSLYSSHPPNPNNNTPPPPLANTPSQNPSTHNALSRHLNALLPPSAHLPLHPLHSIHTNRVLKSHPKKESDIKTLGAADVATLLKELDADPPHKEAGERKARLKEVLGVGERANVVQAVGGGEGEKEKEGVGEKKKEGKLPGKATGPPPGKVLPIGPRD